MEKYIMRTITPVGNLYVGLKYKNTKVDIKESDTGLVITFLEEAKPSAMPVKVQPIPKPKKVKKSEPKSTCETEEETVPPWELEKDEDSEDAQPPVGFLETARQLNKEHGKMIRTLD
jgi:hypothetical protein